eukprot:scaffold7542_cov113-Cylindrotheca_fusiformis.AAC.7
MATKVRPQEIKQKARRLSNVITDSQYFSKLVDWAYHVCDPEGTNKIGKSDLYAGLLLVHVKMAKVAGSAATFPPERTTVNQLFDACDISSTGTINREEFDIFLTVSSAQIFGRILINWLTYIFVIPYYSKRIVDSFGLTEGTYWETVAEQACGLFLFIVIMPIIWGIIDQESRKSAGRKVTRRRDAQGNSEQELIAKKDD